MTTDLTQVLGAPYSNLIEAQVDKSPSEMVISNDNGSTYYIISSEEFENGPEQAGFKIVVPQGE